MPRRGSDGDRVAACHGYWAELFQGVLAEQARTGRDRELGHPRIGAVHLDRERRGTVRGRRTATTSRARRRCPRRPLPRRPGREPSPPGATARPGRSAASRATSSGRRLAAAPARRGASGTTSHLYSAPAGGGTSGAAHRAAGAGAGSGRSRSAPRPTGTGGSSRPGRATRSRSGRPAMAAPSRASRLRGGGIATRSVSIYALCRPWARMACGGAQGAGLALAGPLREAWHRPWGPPTEVMS